MLRLDLFVSDRDTLIYEICSLANQRDYHKKEIAPNLYQVEKWEQKEYEKVNSDNLDRIEVIKKFMIENEYIFNQILCKYNLSVSVFLYKYINN